VKKVAVIGLGRVGLPLACVLADVGIQVVGIDNNQLRVEQVNSRQAPFIENGLLEALSKVVDHGLSATTSYEPISECEYVIITVGTPVDENLNPVLSDLISVIDQVAEHFHPGQTLILRSTVSPGTTERATKTLERLVEMQGDQDFYVAFCPERIAEGRAIEEIKTIPQIVGGIGPNSIAKARELFELAGIETVEADPLSSELAKLFSNMYRYINFAVANEFMMICSQFGSNYEEVRHLVNHNYRRGGLLGAGLTAGPCLYKDGFFLLDKVPFSDLISTSWRINENVPNFLVGLLESVEPLEDITVALLGMAFKGDVDDTRQSLSFRLKKLLEARGAKVLLHDPLVPNYSNTVIADLVAKSSIVIVAVPHTEYKGCLRSILSEEVSSMLVCDIWNVCGTGELMFGSDALRLSETEGVSV